MLPAKLQFLIAMIACAINERKDIRKLVVEVALANLGWG